MKYTLQSSALALLMCLSSTVAFVPIGHRAWGVHDTKLHVADEVKPNELKLDTDFENVNITRLLGRRRVSKFVKKRQSIATAAAAKEAKGSDAAPVAVSTSAKKAGLKIIIAGAPASGKGTQCEIIKKEYGVVHLSTGDMLRAAVAAGTDVGKKAKEFMDAGMLVPDEVIIGVVADRLEEEDCKTNGWLLDGFPRTPGQADALASAGVSADCFIFLNVPDEILVDRVVGRRTDPVTGKIYHMTFSPPDDPEVLARLEQRSDDTEEKVKVRLQQFHANVEAVKGSYSSIGVDVDGTAAPADVSKVIAAAIAAKVSA
jgi:adenylate kinase